MCSQTNYKRSTKQTSSIHVFWMFWLSERWPGDLDRSSSTFSSKVRVELLWLCALTDWMNVSNWVDRGATISFILLSISLEVILRSGACERGFSSPSVADSPELWASRTSTNFPVGARLASDIIELLVYNLRWEERYWFQSWILLKKTWRTVRACMYLHSRNMQRWLP